MVYFTSNYFSYKELRHPQEIKIDNTECKADNGMFAKDQSVSLPINNTLVHHGTRFHLSETYKLLLSFADGKLLNR